MKKIITSILLIFVVYLDSAARDGKYNGFAEAGYGAYFGCKAGDAMSFATSHGKTFGNVFVGGGIGIERVWIQNKDYIEGYESMSNSGWDAWKGTKTFKGINVPVFVNVKGIWDSKKITPAFDVKVGFGVGYAWGLMGEIGCGCRLDFGETALAATVFLKGVYEYDSLVTDDSEYAEGWFPAAGLKVAFEF